MTDYFALLGEPRRPWLESEPLKAKFLASSAEVHPDRVHSSSGDDKLAAHTRYLELNAAYNCLREPKSRLAHLLALERGGKSADLQSIPSEVAATFEEVRTLCGEADEILRVKPESSSPLLRAQWVAQGLDVSERLRARLVPLDRRRNELFAQLRHLNAAWTAAPVVESAARSRALPCDQLEGFYRELSFLTRWIGQLQERLVQLTP